MALLIDHSKNGALRKQQYGTKWCSCASAIDTGRLRKGCKSACLGGEAAGTVWCMSRYEGELADAERQGKAAHDAMEAWVSRPLDAPGVSGEVLEAHAKTLRESRERIRRLLSEEGARDDIEAALARNEEYHRVLGLSIKDKSDPIDDHSDAE